MRVFSRYFGMEFLWLEIQQKTDTVKTGQYLCSAVTFRSEALLKWNFAIFSKLEAS